MSAYRPVNQHIYNKDPNYRFESMKGSGSFGYVFKAHDENTNTVVAIKRSQKVGNLVSREFEILREVEGCDNCVKLLDIFYTINSENRFIQNLVFEYIPDNLNDYIRRQFKTAGRVSHIIIQTIMRQLLEALAFLQDRDIMHRDIKPENILLEESGNGVVKVKLWDFGSAKKISDLNTPYIVSRYYRAPELIFCKHKYDCKIDIWSLGWIFVELYTGIPLFQGKTEGDQLIQIANIMGPPSSAEMAALTEQSPVSQQISDLIMQIGQKQDLAPNFKSDPRPELALALAEKMLWWDPSKRISASEALKDPYFNVATGKIN